MASPSRNVRLRINPYTPINRGDTAGTGVKTRDIIFPLKANRIQKNLTDGSRVIASGAFRTTALSFAIIRYTITIEGVWLEDGTHASHPPDTATEHNPDFIDLEEAALMWNNSIQRDSSSKLLVKAPTLEIEYDGNNWRTYQGLILEMTLVKTAGKKEHAFTLIFGVAYDPVTSPGIREWSS